MPNAASAAPEAPASYGTGTGYVELENGRELAELLGAARPAAERTGARLVPEDLEVLARSPLCLVATSDGAGNCDASPRVGEPGFVHVVDEGTIAVPDRPGDDPADSLLNILENPHVGLVHLVPGGGHALRISGRARILADAPFFADLAATGRRPLLALLVDIDEIHRDRR